MREDWRDREGKPRGRGYRDEGAFPRRPAPVTSGLGQDAGADYDRSDPFDEPFSERYGAGVSGHMYGQHTGYGIGVERYTGGWESTVGRYRGRGPKNYKRSDERIRDEIGDRLTAEPWIDPSDVDVVVEGGRVTLTGTVSDRETKYRIEELVDRVSGVEDVENRVKVRRDLA